MDNLSYILNIFMELDCSNIASKWIIHTHNIVTDQFVCTIEIGIISNGTSQGMSCLFQSLLLLLHYIFIFHVWKLFPMGSEELMDFSSWLCWLTTVFCLFLKEESLYWTHFKAILLY